MKVFLRLVAITCLCCFAAPKVSADVTVKLDSTVSWAGYMNVWQTNGTSYAFGSGWGIPALTAWLVTNSSSAFPLNTALVLKPNTNTYNPADAYWNYPDGTANKVLEANYYRDVGTNFGGQTVTFTGTLLSNTLPARINGHPATGWRVTAVIKQFTPTYGFQGITEFELTTPGPFSVSRAIPAGSICQYGFIVMGPNIPSGSENFLKGVGLVVEDSDPAIRTQPAGATITSTTTHIMSVAAIGSASLTYQWKKGGVPLSNGTKYSGVTTPNLTINNAQVADSGAYTVTVVNSSTLASVDSNPAQLNVLDIVITTAPANQRAEQGSTVTFNVVASSASALTYQWKYAAAGGPTNNLSNGATVSGVTTPTLTLSNVQTTNSGTYVVVISTGAGSGSASATLLVKTYADFANLLENPGFEADPTGANPAPWSRFEQTAEGDFGKLQKATDTYFGGGNVNVHQGTYVSYTTFHAAYSGIFQDVSAQPGQVFTADMYFYNAGGPTGDPIPGPFDFNATNETYLEVQFRAGDAVLQQYITKLMDYTFPQNTWINLQATNAGTYGSMPPTSNARYLVAPPGTTTVRFQVTLHDIANSVGNGSLYYDTARLMLKLPVTVNYTNTGGNVQLSWKSQGDTNYQVQYTDNLTGTWQNLGAVVSGTGQTVTKTDAPVGNRYYRVLTL